MAKTTLGNIFPPLEISGRRLGNTHSTDIPMLLPTLNAIDFKTSASHRGITLIGQRLDGEFNQQIQFEEGQLNEPSNVNDQTASQNKEDDLDAGMELLYEPARAITSPIPSRNLEKSRRKPQRNGQLEVNCITALSSN